MTEISTFKHKDFTVYYIIFTCSIVLKIKRHGENKYSKVPKLICNLLDKYVEWYDYDPGDFGIELEFDNVKTTLGFNLLRVYIDTYGYSEDGWIYDN